MTSKKMLLNAFVMNCPGNQSPGLWRHPDDQSHRYTDLEQWIELAKTLEKAKFDAVFIADVLGHYDVYEGTKDAALRQAVQSPINDPLLIIPAMASVTEYLGFGVTASVTHENPYPFARRMSTLDHLTKGRVGWNIVTSYLKSASLNIGLKKQIKHDERYDIAEEYLEVCYKLWEGSWEDDAVVRDRERKMFVDPAKVHDIDHDGRYFHIPGAHLCEPSPQRTPVIYQAGLSPRGSAFAAKHAEGVYISAPVISIAKKYVNTIRKQAEHYGRKGDEIKIFSLFTPIVGKTQVEAEAKYKDYKNHISREGALSLFSGWTGIDLSQYDPDEHLQFIENDAMRSRVEIFTKADPDKQWTINEIAEFVGIGGIGPVVAGTPETIADEMEKWVNEAGVDGFNITYTVMPGSFEEFSELVIPVLQERGLVKKEYEQKTLRGHLFGFDQLANHHPGKQYSWKHLSTHRS
ncbi:FMN-dependent oxidoreductase (nitrilotriacetate monooxygenase family) [Bacillus thermophilus]|uniref:FMN-dependent oxidoreductase (Nitrilotriacetate monooxygenase family) n=1 Tax=Siminovitchia thermophila TaxID=1245522 RepID=A0ABS2R9B5_9BACI|nr:LLM class flavin-dependent oxidoreductase [Siminovitchia thermophila]MBM7716223.1 FMN-dependent oxidoreductase (nitrilotriacetate monooxygenase family) [Siminovitchia thermophila]